MKEIPPLPNKAGIDFDNTICDTRWNGENFVMGQPLEGMPEAVRECAKSKSIVIFTSRPFSQWEEMRGWLKKHNVPYNEIVSKPLYDFYVDDRNMTPNQFRDYFKPEAPDDGSYDSSGEKI